MASPGEPIEGLGDWPLSEADTIRVGRGNGGNAVPGPSTYTVHKRLLNDAVERLVQNAAINAESVLDTAHGQIVRAIEQVAIEAYTRGVRDGYVQAVSEDSPKGKDADA